MDGVQLRDEAAQDRIRSAVEFLDPSELVFLYKLCFTRLTCGFVRRCKSAQVC